MRVRKFQLCLSLLGCLALASLVGLIPKASSAATPFTYSNQVTYRVENGDSTRVTEAYSITNQTDRQYLTELKISTPTAEVSGLEVTYADGSKIPAQATRKQIQRGDINYDYQEVVITFPRQVVGLHRNWQFVVSYSAKGLVDTRGGSHTVYVPSLETNDQIEDYRVTVDVPAEFGTAHFTGAKSASAGMENGRQFYVFEKNDLTKQALALSFGDLSTYKVNFNFPVQNDSPISRIVTVTLPPDLNNQKVFLDRIDPQPSTTHLDEDGNILAGFKLSPHQRITVKTEVAVRVKFLEYDLSTQKTKSALPADLVTRYTQPTANWPTTGPVADQAAKLVKPDRPVVDNVEAVYRFVIEKLSYNDAKIKFNVRQGATKALADPTNAVCLEYADLMIAMLRSQGIPARMPVGYAYSGSLKPSDTVSDSLHAWVEAYVPGIGWMTLDPTWGEKFDQFGKSDLEHLAFAVWGSQDQSPDPVMAGGRDTGYQYEDVKLNFVTQVEPIKASGALAVTRYALLPFISLDRVAVTAQSRIVTDTNKVKLGQTELDFGSLAPSQKIALFHWAIGNGWNHPGEAALSRTADQKLLVLATSQPQLSYWPMIGVVGLTALGLVKIVMIRLRPRRKDKIEIEHHG